MSNRISNFAVGVILGATIGMTLGSLCAPRPGEDTRKRFEEKLLEAAGRLLFNLRWMLMTPKERYTYLWSRGGSLHDWRYHYQVSHEG